VAYQSGTSTGSFGGIGIDLQGDIGGFGGASSSQTLFAQSVSPPIAPGSNKLGLILLIVGGLLTILGIGSPLLGETGMVKFILMACVGIGCLHGKFSVGGN
jgi:hypothetical protein